MPHSRDDFGKPVGIDKHIKNLEPLLCIGSTNCRIIGIWGMIGIGKTTVATAVFARVRSQFDGYYFLENVSEQAKKQGLTDLRNKLLAKLIGEEKLDLGTQSSGSSFARDRLCRKKVLVVLDGVDNEEQYNKLLSETHVEFNSESRIIVTTRSEQVLKSIKATETYQVQELNEDEANQLLNNLSASEETSNLSDCTELLKKELIDYAAGVPQVLIAVCSYLRCHTTPKEKESALEKLRSNPCPKFQNLIRICYDELDRAEKEIFLDMACFFNGEDREFVERILDGCQLFPKIGINNLIAKSLLFIKGRKLWMNDLIQMTGQEIVKQKSEDEPGNRSRLWIAEDIYDILEKDTVRVKSIYDQCYIFQIKKRQYFKERII